MIFNNLVIQTRISFYRESLLLSSNLYRKINFSSQIDSSGWVHRNQLLQRHPRLQILEQQCNKTLPHLKQLLCYVFVSGLHRNPFIISRFLYLSLVEFKGTENSEFGVRIFNTIGNPNLFSWNTMIRFFATVDPIISVHYYTKMIGESRFPDKYTFPFLLQGFNVTFDLASVQQVHSHIIKLGHDDNLFVQNALLSAYIAKASEMDARLVFDEMPVRDIVTWTSLISGFVSKSNYSKALHLFQKLVADDSQPQPNAVTIVSTMSACGGLGSVDLTKCLHSFLLKAGWLELDVSIVNSLIDTYAKCGELSYVTQVFDDIQDCRKDLYSWTSIISAYGMNGRGLDAIKIFVRMEQDHRLVPDAVTFVSILSACAHSGLVEEGLSIFESMGAKYRILPDLRHYGCVVDILGRAGMVEQAYSTVENMPMEPNLTVLGSLLNSCRLHNELEFGEIVLRKIELLEERGGAPVLLSNMYANENEWSKVIEIRKEMRGRMQDKPPGRSWIQIKDAVYEFIARNDVDPQAMELHMVLESLEKISRL